MLYILKLDNSIKNNCSSFIFKPNSCYFTKVEAAFKNTMTQHQGLSC